MTVNALFQNFIQTLSERYSAGEARSIARIVFEDALKLPDYQSRMPVLPWHTQTLENIQRRLWQQEPVQYVLGQADFYGLKFQVNPAVLIPRQETEELAHWVLQSLPRPDLHLLDIGTGSGCIAITLKKKIPTLRVSATDISVEALAVARTNAERYAVVINLLQHDILDPKKWSKLEKYDIIVSNPPYIPQREAAIMSAQVRDFEPHQALFVTDATPLLFYETIAKFAQQQLRPSGFLFFECNEFNAQDVVKMLENQGFTNVELRQDLNGKDRMIRARC